MNLAVAASEPSARSYKKNAFLDSFVEAGTRNRAVTVTTRSLSKHDGYIAARTLHRRR